MPGNEDEAVALVDDTLTEHAPTGRSWKAV
jgi:hypothetical protein